MRSLTGDRLRSYTQLRFVSLLERLLQTRWPARVQRLGAQALARVTDRFPAIADLLAEGTRRVESWRAANGAASAADSVARAPRAAPPPTTARNPSEALREGLTADHWEARALCIERWGTVRCDDSVPLLTKALHDESAEVAAAAAVALGSQPLAEAKRALVDVIENSEGYFSPVTRAAAVQGLGQCATTAELLAVQQAVTDLDAEVSLAAIAALATRTPEEAGPALIQLLQDGTGFFLPPVRIAAARALVKAGGADAAQLAYLRGSEVDPAVLQVLSGAPTH